ncbi:hypothetical protein WR25_19762 [Diploscapter pachys]|uniref:Uncharacterized protein n=1 Tax=Diploscapter pachys TaxID=2018661 RepID=A0A2A2K4W3_9BILA|nr:hypothetical protein WR25_19762 [Diploscapter pachys]
MRKMPLPDPEMMEHWKRDFSAATLQRGERYAEQGLVQIQSHGESRIDSTCRGSGGNVYRQRIIITARPSGQCHVRGNCSCPHWLQGLEQPTPRQDGAEDRRGRMVCYELMLVDDHSSCALRVRKGTREEHGIRYSRIHSLYELLYEPPKYVKEEDLRILRQLSAQNAPYGQERGYTLKGHEGGELLQRVLDTGRLMFIEGLPLLQQGAERRAQFRWVRLDNGDYRGMWYCGEQPLNCILPLIPLFYFDIDTKEVATSSTRSTIACRPPPPCRKNSSTASSQPRT